MKATSIPGHEQSFVTTGIDSQGKKFKLKPVTLTVAGKPETIKVIDCIRDNNDTSFYYKEVAPKERIVLHYTAGYVKGDIGRLTTQGDRVSVPYVIARSGDIYRLWDDSNWAYHLGSGVPGGNTEMSKRSIAIEISNIGHLIKSGQNLVTSYSQTDVYCALTDTAFYTKVSTPYRGQTYFAAFTEAQYASVSKLLKYLLAKYPSIGRTLVNLPQRYEVMPSAPSFKGIMSHVNFRADKLDIGPAFGWEKLSF
jgi:N-acetylmuramoyl-L-alanine amidase